MKRVLTAMAAVAALAVPLAASASVSHTDVSNAAQFCKKLRADLGSETFKQTYGTNKNRHNAYGKCVSKFARVSDENHSDAVKQCRTEQDANGSAFAAKYGTNKNGKNAFGKCVSQKAKAKEAAADEQDQEDAAEQKNAAKECATERSADADAFREKYGTNANKKNAFGKCVSQKARESETEE